MRVIKPFEVIVCFTNKKPIRLLVDDLSEFAWINLYNISSNHLMTIIQNGIVIGDYLEIS